MSLPVLGMVGGGQLARMTCQAVVGLDLPLHVLAQAPDDSAVDVAPRVTVGSWESIDDLRGFAAACDVVTFDHELVPGDLLETLTAEGHRLRPARETLRFSQDKLHQRRELGAAGLPVPAFAPVGSLDDVTAFAAEHGWPVVLKSRTGGYDGRGVWVVGDPAEASEVVAGATGAEVGLLVEALVDIDRELAVSVVRRPGGEEVAYPLTETVQRDGICVELLAPAEVPDTVGAEAAAIADRIAGVIDLVGHMAVELFLTGDGHLLVNELALRPHNSMHWTIDGARTCQFENHARAVLDWPLGDTAMTAPAVATVNVLGPADGSDPRERVAAALEVPGVAVHLYAKAPRPGRKLGHVTAVGHDRDDTRVRAWQAARRLTGEETA